MVSLIHQLGKRLRRFVNRRGENAVEFEQQVRLLAEASLAGVRERLSHDVHAMLRSEACGYVRARARRVVRVEAEQRFAGSIHCVDQLVERALEHLAQRLAREGMMQVVAIPAKRAA